MDFLQKVQALIFENIASLDSGIVDELAKHLYPGKMLRSKLVQKIAGENQKSAELCAVIEMIHAASLLHDDVIDDAMTRRGKQSVNAIFGNKYAIMFGDILYSKGFANLVDFDKRIAKKIANSVTFLSVGELLDVDLAKDFNASEENYLDMIYKKTASLIEASAYSAAILAGKDEQKYAIYGKNLGIAFQMVDDILDITQDSVTLGKPAMNDFCEGKVTIPYLKMFQQLSQDDKNYLKSLFCKRLDDSEILWLKEKFEMTNAIKLAIFEAKTIAEEGALAIKDENNTDLEKIMMQMIEREF